MKKCTSIINLVVIFFPFLVFGQNHETKEDIYNLFDNLIGIDNTGIYNGLEYREKYRSLDNNHPYFASPNFTLGSIEYNSQIYYNIHLKYNLFNQEVIVKLKDKNLSEAIIKLYKGQIVGFTINDRKFINIKTSSNRAKGFYEIAFEDDVFLLLIKHQKFKKDLYENEQMYVEYVSAKKEYFINLDNSYNELNSKKDIIDLFPNSKQRINQFYRDNKPLRKDNYDKFLVNLLQELKLTRGN